MIPHFSGVDFASLYIEIPIMLVMYLAWLFINRIPIFKSKTADPSDAPPSPSTSAPAPVPRRVRWFDLVNTANVDLLRDEYKDDVSDFIEDQERERRLKGRTRWFWRLYYYVA